MKRTSVAAALFTAILAVGGACGSAQTIVQQFAALPGAVDTCKWFDEDINDRSLGALTRQTDLLFNRVALSAGQAVNVGASSTTAQGEQLVDFHLGSRLVCADATAIYGPTPIPSPT